MNEGTIARRYAQALFELGVEHAQLEALDASIQDFAACLTQSKELRGVLLDPTLSADTRSKVIRALGERLKMSALAQSSVLLIARRRRLGIFSAIAERLSALSDEQVGILRASVTTAKAMPEAFYATLADGIGRATGKKVILARGLDQSLIAGAVTTIGDSTIDVSVRGRLRSVERDLTAAFESVS